MSLFKRIFFKISETLPANWLNQLSGIPVLLPYHHLVSDDYVAHIKGLYDYKNTSQFITDLDWLLKYRKPVHPNELMDGILENKPLPKNTFLLTFDDGLREVYDIVAPILLKKGIPAIFFINPSFIDNKDFFYRCKLSLVIEKIRNDNNGSLRKTIADFLSVEQTEFHALRLAILKIHYPQKTKADELGKLAGINFDEYVQNTLPFMNQAQLSELSKSGFTIGAHSMDHPHYGMIPLDEQISQTIASLDYTRAYSGNDYLYFSFPHEDKPIAEIFFSGLRKKEGLEKLLFFGTQNQLIERSNPVLHRFNAENPGRTVGQSAKSVLFYNALRALLKRNYVLRN